MQHIQLLLILFLLLTFLAGMYCTVYLIPISTETMSNEKEEQTNSCPDLLIQKGTTILLYNTKQKLIPGTNPTPFYNLDEYINYLEIQKKNGIDCPVLFLQQETTTQGNDVYRVRPSPFELEGGLQTLPTSNTKTNDNDLYPGFDSHGQNQGIRSFLDDIHESTMKARHSDNPMDPNWGGVTHTQKMVESGKYDENQVSKPSLFNPKVSYNPSVSGLLPPPRDILE
jgi:hypothetical protein